MTAEDSAGQDAGGAREKIGLIGHGSTSVDGVG